jgi:DNA-binding FadR family transcriptional regulator
MHPAGMRYPIVEAVLGSDAEAAVSVMKQHRIEFGENLIEMERF